MKEISTRKQSMTKLIASSKIILLYLLEVDKTHAQTNKKLHHSNLNILSNKVKHGLVHQFTIGILRNLWKVITWYGSVLRSCKQLNIYSFYMLICSKVL